MEIMQNYETHQMDSTYAHAKTDMQATLWVPMDKGANLVVQTRYQMQHSHQMVTNILTVCARADSRLISRAIEVIITTPSPKLLATNCLTVAGMIRYAAGMAKSRLVNASVTSHGKVINATNLHVLMEGQAY